MQILVRYSHVIDYCENGYISTGTTVVCPDKGCNFEDCDIITVDALPNDIDEWDYYYEADKFIKGAHRKGKIVDITLDKDTWDSSTAIYTIYHTSITATNVIEMIPSTSITSEQLDALQSANIIGGTQAIGSIELKAIGTVPTIDIPITLIIRGDI